MLRRSDADAIASALARRLRPRSSPVVATLSSRRAIAAIASRVASRLAIRSSPRVATLSSRRDISRIASTIAASLGGSRSRASSRSALSTRVRPVSPRIARLSGSSGRSVSRLASSIAERLAGERTTRQPARVSMDAVASAVTRRLRYTDQLGTFPVDAVASAVARRLSASRNRRTGDALASSIAARFAKRAANRESLPANRESDPRPGGQPG